MIELKKAEDFDALLAQHDKVLVDWYADWCGPCRMMMPFVTELMSERPDITIVKVNADEFQELVAQNGVRGLPTIKLFKNGEVVASKSGTLSKNQLLAFVDSNFGNDLQIDL